MALNLQGKRLTTFFGLKDVAAQTPLSDLDVRRNEITSFEHFGTHPELKTLHLEDNRIHSFLGMTKQKGLQELFLRGNPVALHSCYRIMALLTIGFSLQRIDGQTVVSDEREQARKLGPSAALAVSYGWLLDTAPRSAAEYDHIISELRKSRRLKDESSTNVRTVPMVMAANEDGLSNSDGGLNITRETVELQNKALLHFAKRVAQLEHNLSLQVALQAQQLEQQRQARSDGSSLHVDDAARDAVHVTHLELSRACAITFDRGTAVAGPQSTARTACSVTFTPESLVLRHFFTRACLADILFTDITSSQVEAATSASSQFLLGTRDGLNFEITCSDSLTFSSIHKLLHYRVPGLIRPPPPNKAATLAPDAMADGTTTPCAADVQPPPNGGPATEVVVETASSDAPRGDGKAQGTPTDLPHTPELMPLPVDDQTASSPSSSRVLKPAGNLDAKPAATADVKEVRSSVVPAKSSAGPNASTTVGAPEQQPTTTKAAIAPSKQAPPANNSGHRAIDAALPVRIPSRSSSSSSIVVPTARPPLKTAVASSLGAHPRASESSKDSDDDSPPRPPPKRTAWRGKEIRELMIDSSDSD